MATKRFVVIGLGNFGGSIAEALYEHGHDVIAMDISKNRVDAIAAHVSRSAVADGSERDALESLGVEGAETTIVSTGDDITASLLSTLALKDVGVEDVYAKVVSLDHARVMEHMGVTETIFPERESALNLASRLSDYGILNSQLCAHGERPERSGDGGLREVAGSYASRPGTPVTVRPDYYCHSRHESRCGHGAAGSRPAALLIRFAPDCRARSETQ